MSRKEKHLNQKQSRTWSRQKLRPAFGDRFQQREGDAMLLQEEWERVEVVEELTQAFV
jgi:hypothetical protein